MNQHTPGPRITVARDNTGGVYLGTQFIPVALIAAAPDLLEALREIVKEQELGRRTYDVWGMARAAIRKAEGG